MAEILAIKAEEPDQQLVFGEVYAPDRPDSHGDYMTAPEIQKTAYKFTSAGNMNQIDVLHDNKAVKASIVESFIARDNDDIFIPGAWVVGIHIEDPDLWQAVKRGDINGFSMEALVRGQERDVEVEIPPIVEGKTSKSEDHEHKFFVTYDDSGKFKGGMTDTVNGHSHQITCGTHTQTEAGHSHRFSSVDNLKITRV